MEPISEEPTDPNPWDELLEQALSCQAEPLVTDKKSENLTKLWNNFVASDERPGGWEYGRQTLHYNEYGLLCRGAFPADAFPHQVDGCGYIFCEKERARELQQQALQLAEGELRSRLDEVDTRRGLLELIVGLNNVELIGRTSGEAPNARRVNKLWNDGEVTDEKGSYAYGMRSMRTWDYPIPEMNLDPEKFPQRGGKEDVYGYVICTNWQSNLVRARAKELIGAGVDLGGSAPSGGD